MTFWAFANNNPATTVILFVVIGCALADIARALRSGSGEVKYPTRSFLGLTWVGWLNTLILQWLFVRLQGVLDEDIGHDQNGKEVIARNDYLTLIFPVVPLTGWWSRYLPKKRCEVFLGRRPPMEKV